ncbi:hypothetical protein [Sedimentitalea nanhaiensis]|uniref:Uncharacterized protein n=1 Tax=Sedimentitalea nanhaiensis TaxID=999627 RepID=A0A1I6ZB05_9RHOB|nr:hypothetical protein [Sedimentitalea nanhaiensis]SFT59879.1 hypothetical protein SAMN05216236_1049 [Sedimentitalea nanhaiensis]
MTDPAPGRDRSGAVFLERQSYRRRRLMDAARLLPLFGVLLFTLPLLWSVPSPGKDAADASQTVPMSDAIIYVFLAWSALIVIVALFGFSTRHTTPHDSPRGPRQG